MPDLSVIIPTYNNRDTLKRSLETVFAQDFPHERYEVVVIDDGSTDGTREMVAGLDSSVEVKYHWQPNGGRAGARNAGSRLACGRVLFYLDSDVLASPDLLTRHFRYHEDDGGPIGVQGRTLIHPDSKTTPFMKTKELVPDFTLRRRTNLSPYHVITRNLSIRAADLWAVGGFDESFPGYGWEDIELGLRLHEKGVRFFYDPEAIGYHYDVETLERTREKLRQAGQGAVYFWRKHRRRGGLGVFLEIHPVMLPLKWLVYRTGVVGRLIRRLLPWAERRENLWVCSECYNYLIWEAYYEGVFGALNRKSGA
jgi:GT2 family glycosyltransferase